MRLFVAAIVQSVLLTACVSRPVEPDFPIPPTGTAVIILSAGTSEWGFGMTRIYRTDVVETTNSGGVGGSVTRKVQAVPGANDRVAAVLVRDGPRAVAKAGPDQGLCPGSVDVIAADPAVGRFAQLTRNCQGDGAAFDALWLAALRALAPPR